MLRSWNLRRAGGRAGGQEEVRARSREMGAGVAQGRLQKAGCYTSFLSVN